MSALCLLADVKTYLGITVTTTDAVLSSLITNVSAVIESYCNRTFAQATYNDTRNGTGSDRMFLANGPVTAVASVTIDGIAITAAPDAITAGYVFDDSLVYLRPGGFYPSRFNKGVQNCTIVYTAGYATIPADVAQVCIEIVAFHFAKRDRVDKASETLGTSQTISFSQADMPAGAKLALKQRVFWSTPS